MVNKILMYVQALPLLASLFPTAHSCTWCGTLWNATLSYLDVARELRYPGVPTTVFQAARPLAKMGRRRRAFWGKEFGARYVEIRYEDLVADTVRTLGVEEHTRLRSRHAICDAGVSFASLSRLEQRRSSRDSMRIPPPPTEGMRDWRLSMETSDVEMVEAVAVLLLLEFGYEPMYPRIRMRRRLEAGTRRTIRTGYVGKLSEKGAHR